MRYVPAVPLIGAMVCFGYDWLQKGGFSAADAGAILVLVYLFMIFENVGGHMREAYSEVASKVERMEQRVSRTSRVVLRGQRNGFAALAALAKPAPEPRVRVSSGAVEAGRPLTGPLAGTTPADFWILDGGQWVRGDLWAEGKQNPMGEIEALLNDYLNGWRAYSQTLRSLTRFRVSRFPEVVSRVMWKLSGALAGLLDTRKSGRVTE